MANDTDQPASRAIGLAMIDLMREQQNEYGFIPSQAGSTWLKTDYGIAPGYYDTRFNTDFWLANINAAENFGVTGWLDKTRKYADFLVSFAEQHHFTFGAGDDEGWLVQVTGTRTESPRRHTPRSTIMPPKPNSCTGWQTQLMRTATPSSLTAWCAALSRANCCGTSRTVI